MKSIWKFALELQDRQIVNMPNGAEILTAQMQHNSMNLWAVVDTDADKEPRTIEIHGTGNPMHADMGVERKYIASIQDGPFAWHLF